MTTNLENQNMSTKSLNKVQLIGNLTRDPELRYTPAGTAVCTLGLATNRSWTTESGEKKEEAEFHRIVVWNKLAELCSQLLFKGRRVYFEGRLQTRSWVAQDGTQRQTTEIVAQEMLILDDRRAGGVTEGVKEDTVTTAVVETRVPVEPDLSVTEVTPEEVEGAIKSEESGKKPETDKKAKAKKKDEDKKEPESEDIPF